MPNRWPYTWLFLGWMTLITILSLIPISGMEEEGLDFPYIDKVVHFVFHAVGTVLGCYFLKEVSSRKRSLPQTLWLVVGSLLIYGIIIEVIQYAFTSWRSGDITDVLADLLGALAGAAALRLFYSVKGPLKWKN